MSATEPVSRVSDVRERIADLEAEVERLNDALDAAHVRHGMATDWGARLQAKLDAVREYIVAVQHSPGLTETGHHARWLREALAVLDGESGEVAA